MGDYTNMSAYYDLIMTSGYYDYQKIVDNIVNQGQFDNVLELGCGTGLILQELVTRHPSVCILIRMFHCSGKTSRNSISRAPTTLLFHTAVFGTLSSMVTMSHSW